MRRAHSLPNCEVPNGGAESTRVSLKSVEVALSKRHACLAVLATLLAAASVPVQAQTCLIPDREIVSGGPGKDGIPSLTNPKVVSAAEADGFLSTSALVLGVVVNGEARAYPHNVLWWHEIVNDVLGGRPIVVSYCPLTGSGMVYDPPLVDGRAVTFGVSGLLYDNNLLLYDRTTDSLWAQMRVQSVCGRLSGTTPVLLPVVQSTWQAWRQLYPATSVLSFDTGFRRSYTQYPYGDYDRVGNEQTLFPHSFVDPRRPMKELVLGLTHEGVSRAYPYGALGSRRALNDEIQKRPVLVVFDANAQMALAFERRLGEQTLTFDLVEDQAFPFRLRDLETETMWDLTGLGVSGPLVGQRLAPIATYSAMWFAWASFHRATEVWEPTGTSAPAQAR